MSVKRAFGILYLAIVVAAIIGTLLKPTEIAGIASPDPHIFIPTNQAPLQEMNPLPVPEWAPMNSESGAPIVYHSPFEVVYADGSLLWIDEDGTVYSWHVETYDI